MSAWLLPNFGAEEGRSPAFPLDPRRRALAECWSLLFEDDVRIEGGAERGALSWSAASGAAFPFLEGAAGLVPWLVTDDVAREAARRSLPVFGPSAAAARLVGDKAWAHTGALALGLAPPVVAQLVVVLQPADLTAPSARARVEAELARWPAFAQASWILKPRLGASARGRVSGRGPLLGDAGARALPRLAARGGAMLEPWLERRHDLSAQLHVEKEGAVTLLGTTRQLLSPAGLWLGNAGVIDADGRPSSGTSFEGALCEAALAVGERAAKAGFVGPCGIDAFTYLHEGEEQLRGVLEVNARFTTGQISLGLLRRALEAGEAEPGGGFCFRMAPPAEGWPAGARLLPVHESGACLALSSG